MIFFSFFTTRTLSGGLFYFQRVYALIIVSNLVKRINLSFGQRLYLWTTERYTKEVIIKNHVGIFSVNTCNDSFIKSIPTYELEDQSWLAKSQHKDTFLDIGANIGFFTLLAMNRYDYQCAVCFEPNPDTYKRLQKNIELNGLENKVTLIPKGAGAELGNITFYAEQVHTGGSSFYLKDGVNADMHTVPITTIDNELSDLNIEPEKVSFIKIDVEGFELETLRGISNTLQAITHDSHIFVEIRKGNVGAASDMLRVSGFTQKQDGLKNNYLFSREAL